VGLSWQYVSAFRDRLEFALTVGGARCGVVAGFSVIVCLLLVVLPMVLLVVVFWVVVAVLQCF